MKNPSSPKNTPPSSSKTLLDEITLFLDPYYLSKKRLSNKLFQVEKSLAAVADLLEPPSVLSPDTQHLKHVKQENMGCLLRLLSDSLSAEIARAME